MTGGRAHLRGEAERAEILAKLTPAMREYLQLPVTSARKPTLTLI